jgi:hypothetical protein
MSQRTKNCSPLLHLELKATLKELRAAGQQLRRTRSRFAPYAFLQHVYHIYHRWLAQGGINRRKAKLMRLAEQNVRKANHLLRALIEVANGSLEAKTASRWTRALEYALSEDVKPHGLSDFLRAKGGIAGCARTASRNLPKHMRKRNDWL